MAAASWSSLSHFGEPTNQAQTKPTKNKVSAHSNKTGNRKHKNRLYRPISNADSTAPLCWQHTFRASYSFIVGNTMATTTNSSTFRKKRKIAESNKTDSAAPRVEGNGNNAAGRFVCTKTKATGAGPCRQLRRNTRRCMWTSSFHGGCADQCLSGETHLHKSTPTHLFKESTAAAAATTTTTNVTPTTATTTPTSRRYPVGSRRLKNSHSSKRNLFRKASSTQVLVVLLAQYSSAFASLVHGPESAHPILPVPSKRSKLELEWEVKVHTECWRSKRTSKLRSCERQQCYSNGTKLPGSRDRSTVLVQHERMLRSASWGLERMIRIHRRAMPTPQ